MVGDDGMKNYLKDYIREVDEKINDKKTNFKELEQTHLKKISFFQHERLIHLLVTLFYSVFMILFIILSNYNPLYLLIVLILIIFLGFYVKHYFFLENGVQYLYKQHDKIKAKIK